MTITSDGLMMLFVFASLVWMGWVTFRYGGMEEELASVRRKLSGVEAERDILKNRVNQLIELRDKIDDLVADDLGCVSRDRDE